MEDFVWLLFVMFALGCAAMAAFAGFVVAATVATICAFGAATHAFVVTMYRSVTHRGGPSAASGPDEPSFRAYYRGQVWRDLRLAARTGWLAATAEMTKLRGLVDSAHATASWDPRIKTLLSWALAVYAYVGLAIGALLAAAIGLLPALLITLFAAGAWAVGAPLRALERLRRKRTGAYFDCSVCHDRFPLPVYTCPECSAAHKELAPGPFGVLRHRCTCGARLPAVQFKGRERLPSACPNGHELGEGVGTVRTFHVPVAGGPSTGKSTFLSASLIELDGMAQRGELATTVQSTSRSDYEAAVKALREGVPPPKTSGLPPAVVAEVRGKAKSALLYAYDVAGEVYGAEDELRRDPAHGLAEGVVLLVDPFALDRVRADLEEEIDATPQLGASSEPPQRMLERLIGVLEEKGVDLSKVAAAVCVTKIDGLGVEDAIAATPGGTEHERTRAWLDLQGAGNFLRATEGAFGAVRCFAVSALGRTPGTGDGEFVPRGALAPLLWLLARAGVEPVAAGDAQATVSQAAGAAKALDVKPKRKPFTGALDDVGALGSAAYFAVGLIAVGALAAATVPFAGSSGSPSYAVVGDTSGSSGDAGSSESSDPGQASPAPDEEGSPPATTDTGDTGDEDAGGTSGSAVSANSPRGVLRRHFQRLDDGDFDGSFALMTSSYRNANPGWVSARREARPHIEIAEMGTPDFQAGGVAYVTIKFYGRDRYDSNDSDTTCRRFMGTAEVRKVGSTWRYSPTGNHYTVSELPSSLSVCNA
jgi:hypothetical protein